MDKWIRDMTDIASKMYHANIICQAIARGLRSQNSQYFNYRKYMILCKETETKPQKISDLKIPGAFIVGNMIICNKIVNNASLRAMFFRTINMK